MKRTAGLAVLGATLALGLAACNDTAEQPESNVSAAPAGIETAPAASAAPATTERLPADTPAAPATAVE